MDANGAGANPEERWIAAEHRLMERGRKIGWWEAARLAAGHERELPAMSARGLQAATVQTASVSDKQEYLEVAHNRLRKAIRRDLWSGGEPPPNGLDADSVKEVEEAVIDLACNALTATVLADEIERGVISDRRQVQLEQALRRIDPDGVRE